MNSRKKGLLLVTLAPTLWGSSGTLIQYIFSRGVPAEWLVSVRLVFAGVFILLFSLSNKKIRTFAIWKKAESIRNLLVFSIFGMLAIQLTYIMSISHSDSATATILQFTNAVMISVVVAVKTRTWPRRVEMISLALAVLGVFFLVTGGHFNQMKISTAGLVWGILSAVAAVAYTLIPAKLIREFGAIPVVGWAMLISGVLYNFYCPMWRDIPDLDMITVAVLLAIIVFGTMIPYLCFLQGLAFVNPTTASMLGAVEPLSAAVLTVLFLGTKLGLPQIIGMGLVLGTVFIQAMDQPHILAGKKRIGKQK